MTKQALFSFLMSKSRYDTLYGMFSFSAYQITLGGSWFFNHSMNCKGHNSYKNQGHPLTFASSPTPHKYNSRERCAKILFMNETQIERTISKGKSLFALFLIEPNISEKLILFHPFVQPPLNGFCNETFYGVMPLDDQCLPLEYKPTVSFDMSAVSALRFSTS